MSRSSIRNAWPLCAGRPIRRGLVARSHSEAPARRGTPGAHGKHTDSGFAGRDSRGALPPSRTRPGCGQAAAKLRCRGRQVQALQDPAHQAAGGPSGKHADSGFAGRDSRGALPPSRTRPGCGQAAAKLRCRGRQVQADGYRFKPGSRYTPAPARVDGDPYRSIRSSASSLERAIRSKTSTVGVGTRARPRSRSIR